VLPHSPAFLYNLFYFNLFGGFFRLLRTLYHRSVDRLAAIYHRLRLFIGSWSLFSYLLILKLTRWWHSFGAGRSWRSLYLCRLRLQLLLFRYSLFACVVFSVFAMRHCPFRGLCLLVHLTSGVLLLVETSWSQSPLVWNLKFSALLLALYLLCSVSSIQSSGGGLFGYLFHRLLAFAPEDLRCNWTSLLFLLGWLFPFIHVGILQSFDMRSHSFGAIDVWRHLFEFFAVFRRLLCLLSSCFPLRPKVERQSNKEPVLNL